MKIFSVMYDRAICWSRHPRATLYLAILSFVEASFWPFPPPDVMLAPMSLAQCDRAWYFAFLTTVTSVLGGLLGYLIGTFAFEMIEPILHDVGYWDRYQTVVGWFANWGGWVIFIGGFTPVPYKLITIAAGVTGMALIPFVIASIIGRGVRFYLVVGLIYLGGRDMEQHLRKYIDRIGWITIVVIIAAYFVLRH